MNIISSHSSTLADYQRHAAPSVLNELGLIAASASGATIHTADGRAMIDFASGGFGFGEPRVRASVSAQVLKAPLSSRILVNRRLCELVVELAEIAPRPLSVSYVCNSGEEALDSALKLAKGRWPQRRKVVVGEGGDYGSLSHGVHFAGVGSQFLGGLPFQPRRAPFGDTAAMLNAITVDTSAVLLEPLSLGSGDLAATPDFWRALRERCTASGAVLIISELRTGLGIAGSWWATDASGIVPDVLVTGGALSGGHVSIGAYITSRALNDHVYARRNPSLHGSTTGGNPVGCAAALTALQLMREERLAQRQAAFGAHTTLALEALAREQEGLGLMRAQAVGSLVALDFRDTDRAVQARRAAVQAGVWLRPPQSGRILLQVPLIASPTELELGAQRLLAAWDPRTHVPRPANKREEATA
jgi:acetylornithine/succinyldiaminopimelate/putrescine aminotransferase